MGAQEFICTGEGGQADKAFRNAVTQAQYNRGHEGYTGTIAEKSNFTVIECRGSDKEKVAYAQDLIDKDDPRVSDKWGPAGAIKLKSGWLFFGLASC